MGNNKLEQEAKFWLGDPAKLEQNLISLNARLVQPRTYELNLRFDTEDNRLAQAFQALRLRQDQKARLTFKGAADPLSTVSSRAEIEVEVSDLKTAREILEALGYRVVVTYEKYRAAYQLGKVEVSLDEMPFGNFCEIEGPNTESIQAAANQLGLDWEARSKLSYLAIFSALKEAYSLPIDDLTFKAFEGSNLYLGKISLKTAN
jgi:adenylyl cyclase CyaB, putative